MLGSNSLPPQSRKSKGEWRGAEWASIFHLISFSTYKNLSRVNLGISCPISLTPCRELSLSLFIVADHCWCWLVLPWLGLGLGFGFGFSFVCQLYFSCLALNNCPLFHCWFSALALISGISTMFAYSAPVSTQWNRDWWCALKIHISNDISIIYYIA